MEFVQSNVSDTYFGLNLSTHRDKNLGADALAFFQFERLVAAIAVLFCRWTISAHQKEPPLLRLFFALLLAFLAFSRKKYELICAVHILSYAVPILLATNTKKERMLRLAWIALAALVSFLVSHVLLARDFWILVTAWTPLPIYKTLNYLFPIHEIVQAHQVLLEFVDSAVLNKLLSHLFFVTFHIQVGMGYLGIDFLRKEQSRRNQLVRMDMADESDSKENTSTKKQEAAKRFQRGAAPFILLTAVPYMLQIIAFGNINRFAFLCVQHDLVRAVRLNNLFDHDSHLIAMANDSATSPGGYAASMDVLVETVYDLFNRKLFSLPKLMMLPGIIMRQPILVAQISPFIFGSDFVKGRFVAYMTSTGERLDKEAREITAVRTKVESFDMKNAELLQRSGRGATQFTQRRWEELTVKIQQKKLVADLLKRTKAFFSFIQRNFVFTVLIDCALANLIAIGKITSSEIFVFSRAIEDAVDTVLMRSRAESELARMTTEVDKLQQLADVWERSRSRALMPCAVAAPDAQGSGIVVRNLHYSRGSALVRSDHIEFPPGIYALTGVNGSGKSTFFRVLMSCNTNEKSIDLPSSIMLSTPTEPFVEEGETPEEACAAVEDPSCRVDADVDENVHRVSITMPSADVAEISQSFYWPLYARPVDWIYQCHLLEEEEDAQALVRRVAEELQSLEFRQLPKKPVESTKADQESEVNLQPTADRMEESILTVMEELVEVKEDWFNDLSGGQKSKVELVRKVFLHEKCPSVLLIDETMAPLDPGSKTLVMSKLKTFCRDSVVIVIYHTDVREDDKGESVDCVPSNNFFDENIHLVNHTLVKRPVC